MTKEKKELKVKPATPRKAKSLPSLIRKKKAQAKQERLLEKFVESARFQALDRQVKADKQQVAVREDADKVLDKVEYQRYLRNTKTKAMDPKKIARALMPNARF